MSLSHDLGTDMGVIRVIDPNVDAFQRCEVIMSSTPIFAVGSYLYSCPSRVGKWSNACGMFPLACASMGADLAADPNLRFGHQDFGTTT